MNGARGRAGTGIRAWRRNGWAPFGVSAPWGLRALAFALLLASVADFLVMWSDVNALADHAGDSLAWRASQARAEIEQFHIRVATYDGTQSRLDGSQDQYDIAFNLVDQIERIGHSGREKDQFMAAFRDARADLVALGPRIGALRVGDVAAARAMEPDLIALDLAATRMVDRRAPADPIRRDLLRRDGLRADAALGLTAMLLSLGLLLKASAMARRTGERERARQNPDARGAELSRALALAQAGAGATSAVLATIGHEIRTPMNGVLGATSLLAHTKLTDTQRRWVDLARESGEAVLRQLDDVLDCSALEAAPSRREPVFALDAARRITFGAGLDPAAASALSPEDGRLRLLLADDDPINREVASSLLRHLGHDVTAVGGGPDAYAEAQMGRYDCILLDLHMPGMDGVQLARALRALPLPLGAVRLVAITADADAGVHEAARSAGIDSVVTKPVTLERLADALSHQQSLGPLTEPPAIDAAMRRGLVDRLAAGRFAGLLATFWSGLLATLAEGDPWSGDDGDRRLHSLAGASASLGYRAVAAAARRARADRAAGVAGGNAALLAALAAAARTDRSLLPPDLAERLDAALADASPIAATIPAIAGSRP